MCPSPCQMLRWICDDWRKANGPETPDTSTLQQSLFSSSYESLGKKKMVLNRVSSAVRCNVILCGNVVSNDLTSTGGVRGRNWAEEDVPSRRIQYHRRKDRRRGSKRARGRSLRIESSANCIRGRRGEEPSQAMTRPFNLPTPSTLPQSLPSTLTTLHASSPSRSFILVLACPLMPSSPPSTCSGSSSGFVNPSHLDSIFRLGVSTPILSTPCAFADSISRD